MLQLKGKFLYHLNISCILSWNWRIDLKTRPVSLAQHSLYQPPLCSPHSSHILMSGFQETRGIQRLAEAIQPLPASLGNHKAPFQLKPTRIQEKRKLKALLNGVLTWHWKQKGQETLQWPSLKTQPTQQHTHINFIPFWTVAKATVNWFPSPSTTPKHREYERRSRDMDVSEAGKQMCSWQRT